MDAILKHIAICFGTSQTEASEERIEAAQRRLAALRNDVELKLPEHHPPGPWGILHVSKLSIRYRYDPITHVCYSYII